MNDIALMINSLSNIETVTAKALQLKKICEMLCREIDNSKVSDLAPALRMQINTCKAKVEEAKVQIKESENLLEQKAWIEQEYKKYEPTIREIEKLKEQKAAISTDYDALVAKHNKIVGQVSRIKIDLQAVKMEHDTIIKDLQAHLSENNIISEAMKEEKGIIYFIDRYKKDITDMLLKYDANIKELIVRGEQLPQHASLPND